MSTGTDQYDILNTERQAAENVVRGGSKLSVALFKLMFGNAAEDEGDVSTTNPLPVTVISGGGSAGLTNAELRASPVPVSGTFYQATQPVSGPLTDAQLRATAVPVSGTVTANAGSGTFTVAGGKTNNAAAPGATNAGALTALANAAVPTWSEGNLVLLSADLSGQLRVLPAGNVAHDGVDSGNPLKIGGYAADPDSPPAAVASGDRANLLTDLRGRPQVYLASTLDSTNDSIAALGNVAHDAVDSGSPVKIGGYASSTAPTAVAAADRVNTWHTLNGSVVMGLAPVSTTLASTSLQGGANLGDTARSDYSYALVHSVGTLYPGTGSVYERARTVINGMDNAGSGIAAAGMVAQYDDTATGTVTENQFSTLRMGSDRILYAKCFSLLTNPSATLTRVAGTNVYASGDLVANNLTAGSVTPLSWTTAARVAAGNFRVVKVRLSKTGTGITNASFRLHLYTSSPTCANGDNGVWSTTTSGYLGSLDITVDKAFTDGAAGIGVPQVGGDINVALARGQTIYGLLEARGAYTPTSAEVYTVILELEQN